MNRFDQRMKDMARKETRHVPEQVSNMIDTILSSLTEIQTPIPKKKRIQWYTSIKIAVAIMVATFLLLPNINYNIAYAMERIPVLGPIVKVITIREYEIEEGNHTLGMEIPSVSFEESHNNSYEITDYINASIEELTNTLLDEFHKEVNLSQGSGHNFLNLDYDVVTNNDRWFTLRINVLEIAASSNTSFTFYHIDKEKGQIVQLSDLFKEDSDFQKVISDNIHQQMVEQMEADDSVIYWIDAKYPQGNFHTIDKDHNFYFSKDGKLVIAFDKYEVGPGMMGTPEFEIDKSVYEDYLK